MASHDVEKARLRLPTAAAALVGAAAHVPVTGEHLREATYIGVLFVALEVTLVALAVLLVVADRPMVWAASVVVPALAIAAYVASRSVGLPQIGDDVGRWTEPLGVVSVAAEAVMALLALVHHLPQARLGTGRATPAVLALVLLVAGLVATSQAAAARPARTCRTSTAGTPRRWGARTGPKWPADAPGAASCATTTCRPTWSRGTTPRAGST